MASYSTTTIGESVEDNFPRGVLDDVSRWFQEAIVLGGGVKDCWEGALEEKNAGFWEEEFVV